MVDGVPLIAPGTRGRMLVDVTLARIQGETKLTRYDGQPHAFFQMSTICEAGKRAVEEASTALQAHLA